ncbi:4'-phosphopantetheinyl transferase superfamily protein [Bacillus sp. FSL W7-1360]
MSTLVLAAVHIDEEKQWGHYEPWLKKVSPERQARILRMRRPADRIRSLVSELLARKYISEARHIAFAEIEFLSNEYGKPLVSEALSLSFNLSHSGNWVLFALDETTVGVDVEQIHSIEELSLAKRFFDPAEAAQLSELSEKQRQERFFQLWSLKESYIKWKGTGLGTPLHSFRFMKEKGEWSFSNDHGDECFFHSIRLDDSHYMAVCTSKRYDAVPQVTVCEAEDFLTSLS